MDKHLGSIRKRKSEKAETPAEVELTTSQKAIKGGLENLLEAIQNSNLAIVNMTKLFFEGAPTGVIKDFSTVKGKINTKKSFLYELNQSFSQVKDVLQKYINDVSKIDNSDSNFEEICTALCERLDKIINDSSLKASIIIEGLDGDKLDKLSKLNELKFDNINLDLIININNFIEKINSIKDVDIESLDKIQKIIEKLNNILKSIGNINLDNIKLKNLAQELSINFTEDSVQSIDAIVRAVDSLSGLSYSGPEDFDKFLEGFKKLENISNINTELIKSNINEFFNSIKSINETDNKQLIENVKNLFKDIGEQFEIINDALSQYQETLNTILDIESRLKQTVNEIIGNDNEEKLKTYTDTIYNFINTLPKEPLNVRPFIESLVEYNYTLKSFFEDLIIPEFNSGKADSLYAFFNTFSSLGDNLNPKKIKNIKSFFEELNKVNIGGSIACLIQDIFDAIPKDSLSNETIEIRKDGSSKKEKQQVLIAGEQIKALNSLIDVFFRLSNSLDYKQIRKNFLKLGRTVQESIPDFIKIIEEIQIDEKHSKKLTRISNLLKDLNEINKSISKSIKQNLKAVIAAKLSKYFLTSLIEIIKELKDNKFKLDKRDSDRILNTLNNLSKMVDILLTISKSLSKIALTYILAVVGIKGMDSLIKEINKLILKINTLNPLLITIEKTEVLDKLAKVIKDLGIISSSLALIAITGFAAAPGILLAGMVIMGSVMLCKLINESEKDIKKANGNIGEFMKLLLAASGIVLLGAVTGSFIVKHWQEILTFEILLASFIGLTVGVYKLASKDIGEAMEYAGDFAALLVISTGVLLLGGWIISSNPAIAVGAIAFTLLMTGFIFGTVWAYKLNAKDIEDALEVAPNFAVLVGIAGLTLLLGGGLFAAFPQLMITCLIFAGELSLFILLVTGAYRLVAKNIEDALEVAPKFAILIAISALTLLIGGGLFLAYPEMMITTLVFAMILGIFIGMIAAAYTMANVSKLVAMVGSKFSLSAMFGMNDPFTKILYVVTISSIILLVGGGLLYKYGWGFAGAVIGFAWLTAAFIIGMSAVTLAVQAMKIDKKVLSQIALIELLVGGMAALICFGSKAVEKAGGIAGVLITTLGIGIMFRFLGVVALGCAAFGLLLKQKLGPATIEQYIWAAIGVFAGIEFLIFGLAFIIGYIGDTVNRLKNIRVSLDDILNMVSIVGAFVAMGYTLLPALSLSLILPMVLPAIFSISLALSMISNVICDYANLKVPIYEGTKVVGYRQLTKKDFKDASDNVGLVVTTLGGAIMSVWEKHKDWFGGEGISGIFTNLLSANPMAVVCRTVLKLGEVISKIAEGVKDYAELKVPIYQGTKQIGWRNLSDDDFKNASKNVGLVVTTLGNAIMSVFESNPEWFKDNSRGMAGWFTGEYSGDNPMAVVLSTVSKLGRVISDISNGVTVYATGIPIYKDGKVVAKQPINDDIIKSINKNISSVITVLANSIMSLYDNHKDWFKDNSRGIAGWFSDEYSGNNPMAIVLNTVSKLGRIISDIANGVTVFATGIPEYNNGKIVGKHQIDFENNTEKILKNLAGDKGIIPVLCNSIMKLWEDHPSWWYEDRWLLSDVECSPDGPFGIVLTSVSKLGKVIADIAKGVVAFAVGIPEYNDGKIIGYKEIKPETYSGVTTTINSILGVLGESILNCVESHPEWFDDDEDSEFVVAANAVGSLANLISSIATGVKDIASLRLPIYDDKGHITGYVNFDNSIISAAKEAISEIISSIGTSIITAVKDNPELFNDDEDSPGYVAFKAISGMGNIISSIGKAIIDIASLRLPIYDEKGNIIDYNELNNEIIDKAAKAIQSVIMGIVEPFAGKGNNAINIAQLKQLTNNGEKSSFFIVCDSISKITSLISAIGSAIKDISQGVLVTQDLTSPDGTKNVVTSINNEVIEKAKTVITEIITSLGSTLTNLAKDSSLNLENFASITQSFEVMTNIIATIGDVLYKLGTGTITITGKDGKTTTIPINEETYGKVSTAVTSMLTAISTALKTASGELNSKENKINILAISLGLKNITDTIGTIADVILKLGVGLPVYKNGKIDHYEDVDKNIEKVKTVLSNIIVGLGKALAESLTQFENNYSPKNTVNEEKIKAVFEGISKMSEPIKSISDLIFNICGGNLPIQDEKGNIIRYDSIINKFDNTNNKLGDFLTNIISILPNTLSTVFNTNKNFITAKDGNEKSDLEKLNKSIITINAIITSMITNITTIISNKELMILGEDNNTLSTLETSLDNIINTYSKIYESLSITTRLSGKNSNTFIKLIENINSETWNNIKTNLSSLTGLISEVFLGINTLKDNENINKFLTNPSDYDNLINNISSKITKIFNIYSSTIKAIVESNMISYLEEIKKNNITYKIGIKELSDMIDKIFGIIPKLNELGEKTIDKQKIIDLLNDFNELGTKILNINKELYTIKTDNEFNGIYSLEKEIEAINNIIHISETLTSFKENTFDNFLSSFSKLTKGLIVDEKNIGLLERQMASIEKFQKNINSISENKINSITRLSNSLIKVTAKFGSLEKLTDTLSTKLNQTLVNLTEKLETASTIINKTEEIQTNRQKKLEESIKTITKIMDKQLTVKVDATELSKLKENQSPQPGNNGDGANIERPVSSNLSISSNYSGSSSNYSNGNNSNNYDKPKYENNSDDLVTKLIAALSSVTLNVKNRY